MNRLAYLWILLIVFALACYIPGPAPAPATTAPPDAAPTATDTQPAPDPAGDTATPTITLTPAPETNLTCNELALYLDPGLASGHTCNTVPASGGPDAAFFETYPQHTNLTFTGYVLADRFMTPHIEIYPVAAFQALVPDAITNRVSALNALIGGAAPGDSALPLLPVFNAAEMFHAQYAVVPFQNGSGVRYIAMYGQAYYPVNNHDMFFSYQGLTSDGQYWISIILPIAHGSLPPDGNTPPGGNWDAFYADAETYFDQKTVELNGQAPDSFQPSILLLDAMIQSMVIHP